jgi:uncharacterized membrane protein YeaQ/YmgE (transglycosylase-associated protein family)
MSTPTPQVDVKSVSRIVWPFAFAGAVGSAGLIAGFAGPLIYWPASNQGPLFGIFMTGPGGAVLGAVLGSILPHLTKRRHHLVIALVGATIVYGLACWFFIAVTAGQYNR